VDEYVYSGTCPLTNVDEWTVTGWVLAGSLPQAAAYAVCVGFDNGTDGDGYAFGISGSGSGGFGAGTELWGFFPGLGFDSFNFMFSSLTNWTHIVMLRTAGTTTIYVDGEVTANMGPDYRPITPTSLEIGSGGSDRYFDGEVDDVRLYNRALSASEVQQLYELESGASPQSNLSNGLIAYYQFDGNLNDASGNGFTLNNSGATFCPDRFGNANQAISFNGVNEYVYSETAQMTNVDEWTVTAWVRPGVLPQAAAYAVCVGFDNGVSGDGYGLGISGGSGFAAGDQVWGFFPGGGGFDSYGYEFTSITNWVQLVMLRTGGLTTMYANGSIATSLGPDYEPKTPTSFEVGSAGSDRFFDGAVDDVRLYNRALSSSEIQQLYELESTVSTNSGPSCTPHSATATAVIAGGFVIAATISDNGCGYSNAPTVLILDGGGTGATATAVVSNGMVESIIITDAGSVYTSVPDVFIAPPGGCVPHAAVAALVVSNGFVIGATITDPGCGYTKVPSLQIVGGGGTGATATAVFTNGEVVAITITDAGIGYTNTPGIYFSSPLAAEISLLQVVEPAFSNLSIGENYQLQSSTDLITWINQGPAFMATNTIMNSSQYFNVLGTSQLYFRLQGAP
jgi:hypothetical protein